MPDFGEGHLNGPTLASPNSISGARIFLEKRFTTNFLERSLFDPCVRKGIPEIEIVVVHPDKDGVVPMWLPSVWDFAAYDDGIVAPQDFSYSFAPQIIVLRFDLAHG